MVTKEEKSDRINEILKTDIEWDRLLGEDLDEFMELVETGELANREVKYIAKELGKEELDSVVDNWSPGQLLTKVL